MHLQQALSVKLPSYVQSEKELSEIDAKILGLGLLCLIGGILLACFGYFAPPYFLIFAGWPVDIVTLLVPFGLVFLGIAMIYGGLARARAL
jgi:hypothetical protein